MDSLNFPRWPCAILTLVIAIVVLIAILMTWGCVTTHIGATTLTPDSRTNTIDVQYTAFMTDIAIDYKVDPNGTKHIIVKRDVSSYAGNLISGIFGFLAGWIAM
jgi:hypothetical protein